ncbi:MAG: sulfite exporter TauE/SafE family protein [Thermoleophilaceae bacterium]|nr:sulfite exporter TauE/SafE family protein [Thermoleophilaceae bacterium]
MAGGDQNELTNWSPSRRDAGELTIIGLAAGVFSAMFGVGGGTVMVPLLVLWRGFNEKRATGTSLLAIVIIAAYAVVSYGIFGSVDVEKGLLIGIPAVAGVLFGTWIQQRISDRVLSGMFAVLMLVIIALYLVK